MSLRRLEEVQAHRILEAFPQAPRTLRERTPAPQALFRRTFEEPRGLGRERLEIAGTSGAECVHDVVARRLIRGFRDEDHRLAAAGDDLVPDPLEILA